MGRDIFRYDATCADDSAFANRHTWQHRNAAANPDVVADGNGMRIFQTLISSFCIQRMASRVETYVGRYEYVAANADLGAIQNYQIDIGIEVFSQLDVIAVIAMKGRFDEDVLPCLAQQRFQNTLFALKVPRIKVVISMNLNLGL